MFEFGRELRRIFRNHGRVDSDPSLYELMNLQLLITQGRQFDIEGGRVSTKNRFMPYLEAAQIWREYGRRTGDPVALRRAATAAENAGKEAKTAADAAAAALEQAQTCILSADLFETWELLSSAEELLAGGRAAVQDNEALRARFNRAEAQLAARLAMKQGIEGDLELALLAMSHIDRAVDRADKRVQHTHAAADKIEAAQARFERADLLMRVGLDRCDPSLMAAVIKDFEALQARFDPAYEPVTWSRVNLRHGLAMIWKGEIEGNPGVISEGIALLSNEDEPVDFEHSPTDWVAHKQALAMGLQALAEMTLNEQIYEKAMQVYDIAIKRPLQKGLALRGQLVNNRAGCLAKHAELKGDLKSLDRAEADFKAELRACKPEHDPVGWAILQTNLARLYVARGDITGFMMERTEAAYALEAALEIFDEQHLKSLAKAAQVQLDRVRETA
jgi:tetratricopeptide (TPR) repeat protein